MLSLNLTFINYSGLCVILSQNCIKSGEGRAYFEASFECADIMRKGMIWGEMLLLQFSIWTVCVYMRERHIQRPAALKHFSDFHIDSILEVSRDMRFFLITFSQTLIANPEKIISNSGGCWLPPTAWPERTLNIEPVCKSVAHSVLPMWPENLTLDRLIF